ncbi:hypothetical protein ABPG72_015446 [Tetrahymena utriculariae]
MITLKLIENIQTIKAVDYLQSQIKVIDFQNPYPFITKRRYFNYVDYKLFSDKPYEKIIEKRLLLLNLSTDMSREKRREQTHNIFKQIRTNCDILIFDYQQCWHLVELLRLDLIEFYNVKVLDKIIKQRVKIEQIIDIPFLNQFTQPKIVVIKSKGGNIQYLINEIFLNIVTYINQSRHQFIIHTMFFNNEISHNLLEKLRIVYDVIVTNKKIIINFKDYFDQESKNIFLSCDVMQFQNGIKFSDSLIVWWEQEQEQNNSIDDYYDILEDSQPQQLQQLQQQLFVTSIINFISEEICLMMIKCLEINLVRVEENYKKKISNKIKCKIEKNGREQQIYDIVGTIIPIIHQKQLKTAEEILKTIQDNQKRQKEKNNLIDDQVQLSLEDIEIIRPKLIYHSKKIKKFLKYLDNCNFDEPQYEKPISYKKLIGVIDCFFPTDIIEFKFVQRISYKHILQVVLYWLLYRRQVHYQNNPKMYLFNIKQNQIMEIKMTQTQRFSQLLRSCKL